MSRAKIIQICKDLGIKKILVVDDELRGRCPFGHHEDWHPSWGINLDSGLSHCFACGEDANLITLVMHLKEMSLWEAKQYLNEVLPDYQDVSEVARQIQALQVDQRNLYLDNIIMDAYLNLEDMCESCRDIPFYIYKRYGVKYDPVTGKIAIPVYDEFGRLRVVIGRKADNVSEGPKYKPLVPESGARFKDVLYGLYQVFQPDLHSYQFPHRPAELYVTEGYWGVYRLVNQGMTGVVALMGTTMSDGQFRELVNYDQIILLLDPDEAGRKATKRIAKQLSRHVRCLIPRKQYEKEPDLWDKKDTFKALSSLKLAL